MDILVAPNGVGIELEYQRASANPPLLMTLAGAAGGLVRASMDVVQPIQVRVNVARADDVGIVWALGPWVLHASDLRAGTLAQYCEMVRRGRAKSAMSATLLPNQPAVQVPRYVMSLLACDEGIPVGIIVQHTANPPPLPALDVKMSHELNAMWLTSAYANIVARIGEPALRTALATVAQLRASTRNLDAFFGQLQAALKAQSIVDEEAIACMYFEEWERNGGAETLRKFLAMAPA